MVKRRSSKGKAAAIETSEIVSGADTAEDRIEGEQVEWGEDAPQGMLNTGELDEETGEDSDVTTDEPIFADNGERDSAVNDAVEFVESVEVSRIASTETTHTYGDQSVTTKQEIKLLPGESFETFNPSHEFLERTCGSCLFQKKGKCLVGPATIDKAGDVGANNIYSAFTEYRSVAKKVTPKRDYNNETHEEYEERAEAQTDYEFNDACGQYVGKPVVIKTTSEEMAALMVSSTS